MSAYVLFSSCYFFDGLPEGVQAMCWMGVLVIWIPVRIFLVYLLYSYQQRLERGEILYIEYSRR